MEKQIIYGDVPDFDQQTHYVVEKRTEYDDRIQVDFEVLELAIEDTPMPETPSGEFEPYVQEPTLEEKIAQLETSQATQDEILAILIG